RRHTRSLRDWSSDVCSSDLLLLTLFAGPSQPALVEDKGRLGRAGDFEQKGTLLARKRGETGIVYFAVPYTAAPRVTFAEKWFVRSEERRVGKECRSGGWRER